MAFCPNCGAPAEGRFCAKCGAQLSAAAESGSQPSYTAPIAASGLTDNVAGALCYVLGLVTGIVFLVLAPYNQNKFVRFNAFQAIFAHVALIALWIVESMLAFILPWSLHFVTFLISTVLIFGALAVWILLIVKAYQGERFKLPVIGDIAEKQA